MKLKIISDGTNMGTRVINEETGEPIGYIQSINWNIGVNDAVATTNITLAKIPVEFTSNVNIEYQEIKSKENEFKHKELIEKVIDLFSILSDIGYVDSFESYRSDGYSNLDIKVSQLPESFCTNFNNIWANEIHVSKTLIPSNLSEFLEKLKK